MAKTLALRGKTGFSDFVIGRPYFDGLPSARFGGLRKKCSIKGKGGEALSLNINKVGA
jgi:hypothetical protein